MVAAMKGAAFSRGSSRQDYATPQSFIDAFESRFGKIRFDLAASIDNFQANSYYSEKDDSLSKDWSGLTTHGQWAWLNPPFSGIAPWAKKCAESSRERIAFLVPASVGSNWWREHVHDRAAVLFLNGRLSFDGKNPYPKDCALCLYSPAIVAGYEVWAWRGELE